MVILTINFREAPSGQKSLLVHTLRVYTVFRHPKLQNKDGRLICLDCAARGP